MRSKKISQQCQVLKDLFLIQNCSRKPINFTAQIRNVYTNFGDTCQMLYSKQYQQIGYLSKSYLECKCLLKQFNYFDHRYLANNHCYGLLWHDDVSAGLSDNTYLLE